MASFSPKRVIREPSDGKLRELILYISARLADDPYFGDTKLNKVLFYSDFTAYVRLGKPITSQRYVKQVYGPIVHQLLPVRQRMEENKECAIRKREIVTRTQTVTVPLRKADLKLFSSDEISIVDEMIEAIRPHTARDISDLSHNFVGWKLVDIGDEIPYETVFLSDRELTPAEERWARNVWKSRRASS